MTNSSYGGGTLPAATRSRMIHGVNDLDVHILVRTRTGTIASLKIIADLNPDPRQCVRLNKRDAEELAQLLNKGVPVTFL